MRALSSTRSSRRRLLAAAVCAGLAGCGGGGSGGNPPDAPVTGVLGAVFAVVQGVFTGQLSGELARLPSGVLEVSGTVLIEGNTFEFRAPLDAADQFRTRVEHPRLAEGLSAAPASSLVLAGKVETFDGTGSPYSVTGTFQWELPAVSAFPAQGPRIFSGTIQPPPVPNNGGDDFGDPDPDPGSDDFDASGRRTSLKTLAPPGKSGP